MDSSKWKSHLHIAVEADDRKYSVNTRKREVEYTLMHILRELERREVAYILTSGQRGGNSET